MGAGQSTKEGNEVARRLAHRAFSKEHGRDPTKEEEERMAAAVGRDDPTDAHLGPVEAEEADACREITRAAFKSGVNREPTDEELSKKTDTLARAFRRAALEALEPDVETVRRELVRRAVEAEKASGAAAPSRVAFGPPPRPADEGAAAGPAEIFEREARAEHEKVRVVAAATHGLWSSTTADSKKTKIGLDNLLADAENNEVWDSQVKVCGDSLAKLPAETRELHTAAADRAIDQANHKAPDRSYATALQILAGGAYDTMREPGGGLDYPSLSSDDAVDIGLRYESVPWEDLEAYDPDTFDSLIKSARRTQRQVVIQHIHEAALAKRERDAAAELKAREAQSRAAEAELLALLDDEATAPKKKKKKKKKKAASRSQSPATLDAVAPEAAAAAPAPVAAPAEAPAAAPAVDEAPARAVDAPAESPAETVADDWETAADAGAAPAPLEEEAAAPAEEAAAPAAEAAAPAEEAAAPEPNAWKTPVEAETPAEAPAPAEEDAWETVGRRPRRASDAAPAAPVRRRGTVINVNKAEGYCFVQPDAGGTNVFLSFKERYAQEGDRVEYELVPSGRPERHAVKAGRAVNLSRATEARAPDWWCAACETNNFAARPACRRCGAARLAPKDEAPVPEGRFTGVVVGAWRGCYFVRGEDGSEDLLMHADDLDAGRPTRVDLSAPPCNAILAVGDRVCYALARARYADRLAYRPRRLARPTGTSAPYVSSRRSRRHSCPAATSSAAPARRSTRTAPSAARLYRRACASSGKVMFMSNPSKPLPLRERLGRGDRRADVAAAEDDHVGSFFFPAALAPADGVRGGGAPLPRI